MLGTECLDGQPFRTCREVERDKLSEGAVSWPIASPLNTPSFVRLHAGDVGGSTIYREKSIPEVGNLDVLSLLNIVAVVASAEAFAYNQNEFF
jgi:hypothetical protein